MRRTGTALPGQMASAGVQRLIVAITLIAILYNAGLAFVAAHGGPASKPLVVACELIILGVALATVMWTGLKARDGLPLAFLGAAALIALIVSLNAETLFVDYLRNVLIITSFTMLGARCSLRTVRVIFAAAAAIAFIVLLIEVVSLETYASLFRPGDYLEKTRGYVQPEFYLDVGLSKGTIAYRGRFSFGLFDGPRTSTIFLEQVGINCFAIVLMVYLLTLWSRLSVLERLLIAVTVGFILVTNNARMATILVFVFAAGWFVFPRLPSRLTAVIPLGLLGAVWVIFQFRRAAHGDDLVGRLGITYDLLSRIDAIDLLFGNQTLLTRTFDTGYAYLIVSATLFGALAYWVYLTLILPKHEIWERRCAWGVATYIYIWLLVGGTGSFSIKTAPLLWLLVGLVRSGGLNAVPAPMQLPAQTLASGRRAIAVSR